MSMLQLDPPLPLTTPKGPGLAHVLIDYGAEHHLLWTVFITSGPNVGQIWSFSNPEVRAEENISLGRSQLRWAVANSSGIGFKHGPSFDRAYLLRIMERDDVLLRLEGSNTHIEGTLEDIANSPIPNAQP